MPSKISNRRVSSLAGLDRKMIRELCDLHPWDMGQLCEAVALNKSAFSNFLTGRRPLPEKFAPQFLRQIGLTIKGEMDPRHCFYFAVGPGRQDFAGKWISRLFPRGGDMWTIVSQEQFQTGEDEVEIDVYELGVLLCCDDKVAIVRDDVNFGDVSWIPGDWKNVGQSLAQHIEAAHQRNGLQGNVFCRTSRPQNQLGSGSSLCRKNWIHCTGCHDVF